MEPLIMSCPLGSNINPFRIQSNSFRKCWRFSLMLLPTSTGPPPATRRTGLPQVCASIQKKVFFIANVVSCSIDAGSGYLSASNRVFRQFVVHRSPDLQGIAVLQRIGQQGIRPALESQRPYPAFDPICANGSETAVRRSREWSSVLHGQGYAY